MKLQKIISNLPLLLPLGFALLVWIESTIDKSNPMDEMGGLGIIGTFIRLFFAGLVISLLYSLVERLRRKRMS